MPRSISRVALWYGLLVLVAAAGCERGSKWDLAQGEGTITQAGNPLVGIKVIFWADVEAGTLGPRASGFTDAAGHFELRTDAGDRGAVIGRYRVCLLDARNLGHKLSDGSLPVDANKNPEKLRQIQTEASAPPRVLSRFGSAKETPLRIELHPGSQVINFDVKDADVEVKLIGVQDK